MKNVNKLMALLFLLVTVFSNINVYAEETGIKIYIDGVPLAADETPISINGRVLVPFRPIFETLDFNVRWEAEAKQINARRQTSENRISCNIQILNNRMIVMLDDYVTESNGFVNDTNFEVPPQIINGKTYIPLRAVSEALGCDVDWNSANKTVSINAKGKLPAKIEVEDNTLITPNVIEETSTESTTEEITTEQQRYVVIYSDDNKPVVGETPGNILKDPTDPDHKGADKYTDAYMYGSIGQCVWYAKNRFYEVHNIKLYLYQLGQGKNCLINAKKHEDLKVITNINDIQGNTIAVLTPKDSVGSGHMVYIEYVERDSKGTPVDVYFTETNGPNSLNRGEFDPGYDGVVQKTSFDEFKKGVSNLEIAGYIAANK